MAVWSGQRVIVWVLADGGMQGFEMLGRSRLSVGSIAAR